MDVSLSSSSTNMTLLFTRLRTSYKGIYWCRVSVNDEDAGINIMNNLSAAIIVQSKSIGLSYVISLQYFFVVAAIPGITRRSVEHGTRALTALG